MPKRATLEWDGTISSGTRSDVVSTETRYDEDLASLSFLPSQKRQRLEPRTKTQRQTEDDEPNLISGPARSNDDNAFKATFAFKISTNSTRIPAFSPTDAVTAKSPLKQLKLEDILPQSRTSTKISHLISEATGDIPVSRTARGSFSPIKHRQSKSSPLLKQKAITMELKKPHPAPANWRAQYTLIEYMRGGIQAPVDTMGCVKYMSGEGPPKVRL